MSKLRVLHCIHSLSGGGAERQLKILVDNLEMHDVVSAIFCADDDGNDIESEDVVIYKVRPEDRYRWGIISLLNRAIKEFKPDIVHTWLPASMTIPSILVAAWNHVPIVFSYRNRRYFHTKLTYPEYILASIFVSKIITNNPAEQSILPFRWLYKFKKGELIPNSVNISKKYIKTEYLINQNKCNILFAGRITYQKNIEVLLFALSKLKRSDWALTVCGDGEGLDTAKQLIIDLGIGDKVEFKGYCKNLYEVMHSSDLLVFPSRFEGMPNVLVEAMEIGLPCLVSNILPHKYILGDRLENIMFDPEDIDCLKNKLENILNDRQQLVSLSEIGKAVASSFCPDRMASKYANVYKSQLK